MALRSNRVVFIVDDDEDVRDSTQELLRCVGIEAQIFASGREFLDQFVPDIAICIMLDLHMPDISGFQVLDALQARGNTVPIVLFSGRSDRMTAEFAERSGVAMVLAKPVDGDILIAQIEKIASGNQADRHISAA